MGKRGPKPKYTFSTEWTPELAYAVGLLATDGCLTPYFHQINLTSKDREQIENFAKCLGVPLTIGKKGNGADPTPRYFVAQFKSRVFYDFLISVGLTPAKSKTIGSLRVPTKYFWDFLRGAFDGDGSSYSYRDPRWPTSFMFYLTFNSASKAHIEWLRKTIRSLAGAKGHVSKAQTSSVYSLRYGKREAVLIILRMYRSGGVISLTRKRLKIEAALAIIAV
jgi:hypothetical protein